MEDVFILGGNHHNTLGVLRSLGVRGIKSNLLLCSNENFPFVKYSRYIKRCNIVVSDESAINILLKEKDEHGKAVVIACSDSAASALDLHRNDLAGNYIIPGTEVQGSLTDCMDKEVMSEIGRRVGFNVPESWRIDKTEKICTVEYPCIVKPLVSKNGQKSDIKVCYTSSELDEAVRQGNSQQYQIQKFIEKEFEYQLIGLSLRAGDEVIIPGVSQCIRPCPATNTGFLYYRPLEEMEQLADKCKTFVRTVGYSGLFSLEFLRDKYGKDYFMEMNFRNDGNAICVTAAGYNLPYIWYLANSGGDYVKELRSSVFSPVFVMPEIDDFRNFVMTGQITFSQWLKDFSKTDRLMEFDSRDIKPFLKEMMDIMARKAKKLCTKF